MRSFKVFVGEIAVILILLLTIPLWGSMILFSMTRSLLEWKKARKNYDKL